MEDNCNSIVPDSWKLPYENDFQWKFRKMFIERNFQNFSDRKSQLIALSMTWSNITFLGCRYHPTLMERMTHLSKGIVVSYSSDKKDSLCTEGKDPPPKNENRHINDSQQTPGRLGKQEKTRTSGAETNSERHEEHRKSRKRNISGKNCGTDTSKKIKHSTSFEYMDKRTVETNFQTPLSRSPSNEHQIHNEENVIEICTKNSVQNNQLDQSKIEKMLAKLRDFVVLEHEISSPLSNVYSSAMFNKENLKVKFAQNKPNEVHCVLSIRNVVIGEGQGSNKKTAKSSAGENAFSLLKAAFPVITKSTLGGKEFKDDCIHLEKIGGMTVAAPVAEEGIPASNVGHKLLQKLGWRGGGLGKDEHGRTEPVEAKQRATRAGLGIDLTDYQDEQGRLMASKIDHNVVRSLLREVAQGEREYLVFSSSLCKAQRKRIHGMCNGMGLISQSYGKGNDRYMTIRCKINKTRVLNGDHGGGKLFSVQIPSHLQGRK